MLLASNKGLALFCFIVFLLAIFTLYRKLGRIYIVELKNEHNLQIFSKKKTVLFFKIAASGLFLKYSKYFAAFNLDILIKCSVIKKQECSKF